MSGGEGPRANGFKMPAQQQAVRKYRRDTSEVSCCLKYVIFSVNVLFWITCLLASGMWEMLPLLARAAFSPTLDTLPAIVLVVVIVTATPTTSLKRGFPAPLCPLASILVIVIHYRNYLNKCIFSIISWVKLLGLSILAVGVWAWSEKDTFNNLGRLANVALDPAFALICLGTVTFVIGFTGCVGALRENTCLLAAYALFLAIILLLEITAVFMGFIFKDWIKLQATGGFQAFIIHYREDPDQQNLIDWIQEDWLQCCGIEGPKDWDKNNYFNCSSRDVGSREACGVPFSCCKRKPNEIIKNKQCGYDVRKPGYFADGWTNLSPTQSGEHNIFERGCLRAGEEWVEANLVLVVGVAVGLVVTQNFEVSKIINEKGCIQAGEEWMERNLLFIATMGLVITFLQILGICFSQNLRADIFAQKAKWH